MKEQITKDQIEFLEKELGGEVCDTLHYEPITAEDEEDELILNPVIEWLEVK